MMNSNIKKIILFGLSADMPHKGHVDWISNLKEKFPNHTLIVMPCSFNPLGKKDKDGKIIYPSNGFIRWQMLYEYFQKNDPEIIVSQYEVAINIPSKTYTTIQYLQYTQIATIKNQRGYDLPVKYPKDPINEVSIAIGSDIITEFDKWYEWQKILKISRLLVMKRAGFEGINLQKIKNPKLKAAFIDGIKKGSIIEIPGPQINISSTELKAILQKNNNDETLRKYIPDDILSFIRKHKIEFANSYFQNPNAYKIYTLAMQEYKKALENFDLSREKGLSAFISDFTKIANIDKYANEGIKLNNGRLDLDLNKLNHPTFSKQIKKWMKQSLCDWYMTNEPSGKIISPKEFNANFKILGKYGPNLAIDLIVFIKEDDKIKLLTIKRNDDQKTLAIPGGFYQEDIKSNAEVSKESILKTAVHEFLEECFSNKLFAKNSLSSKLINITYKKNINLLHKKLTKIIADTFQDSLLDKKILNFLVYASENEDSSVESTQKFAYQEEFRKKSNLEYNLFNTYPSSIIDSILSLVNNHYIERNQCSALLAKLKCNFYMFLLPENYQKLCEFLSKGRLTPEEPNLTDPRNTNLAWMVIRCVSFLLTHEEWQKILKQCALNLSGGDDAASAAIIPIDKFCLKKTRAFMIHKYFVLRELAKFYEENRL